MLLFNENSQVATSSPVSLLLKRYHGKLLTKLFRFSAISTLFPILLLGLILLLALGTRIEFMPSFNEESYTIELLTKPGTSLQTSKSIAQTVEASLGSVQGIRSIARRTGRAENDEHSSSSNYSEIDLVLEPGAPREKFMKN